MVVNPARVEDDNDDITVVDNPTRVLVLKPEMPPPDKAERSAVGSPAICVELSEAILVVGTACDKCLNELAKECGRELGLMSSIEDYGCVFCEITKGKD